MHLVFLPPGQVKGVGAPEPLLKNVSSDSLDKKLRLWGPFGMNPLCLREKGRKVDYHLCGLLRAGDLGGGD